MSKKDAIKMPETPPVWDPDLMATIDKSIGPDFTDDALVKRCNFFQCTEAKLQGKVYKLQMKSEDSKIYKGVGIVKGAPKLLVKTAEDHEIHGPLGGVELFKGRACNAETPEISKPEKYKRQLEVFVPESVDTSKESPFMIFLDGMNVLEALGQLAPVLRRVRKCCCCCCKKAGGTAADAISFMRTMDNLITKKELEPMVCIFLNPGGVQDETCIWGTQRNLEYDTVSNKFTEFVETEVLPFVSEKCNVKLTTNPDERAVMGTSSGGIAAITMGLSGKFRKILAQSPSCVNLGYPYNPEVPLGGWDYHSGKELIKNQPSSPRGRQGLRFVVFSNEFDLWYQSDVKYSFNWTAASLRTVKALKEKGYTCLHIFAKEGIHVDPRAMAQGFPDAVKWLWADAPAPATKAW